MRLIVITIATTFFGTAAIMAYHGGSPFAALVLVAVGMVISFAAFSKKMSVKTPRGAGSIPEIGACDVECVGENFCMGAITKIVGGNRSKYSTLRRSAILIPEQNNPYYGNAVAVYIDGAHVAYLDRVTARKYRVLYGQRNMTCSAEIRGSWRDQPRYGVFLDAAPFR